MSGMPDPRCGDGELASVPLVGTLLDRSDPADGFVDSKPAIVPPIVGAIGTMGGGGMLEIRAGAGMTTGVAGTLLAGDCAAPRPTFASACDISCADWKR